MKKTALILFIFLGSFSLKAQNVIKDVNGNYTAIKKDYVKGELKTTGKTYTDSKGQVFPVYITEKEKLFVVKTSKSGNEYRFYLKEQ